MQELDLRAHIAAPVDLVYQVVADVEQYPSSLPDVAAVDRRDDIVAMTLQMGLMSAQLVTRLRFTPTRAIDLSLIEGPFRRFDAVDVRPGRPGTDVAYHADYELR